MSSVYLRRFRRDMTVLSLKAFQWAVRYMPRWCIWVFMEIGFIAAFYGIKTLKRICIKNFSLVYGPQKNEDEYTEMARRCFKNISRSMLDLLYFVERPTQLAKIVTVENEEYLQRALQVGHGVIAVTAHLGNFPLMFVSLVQRGYKVNVLIRPMRNKEFGKFMQDLCAKWRINMISLSPRRQFIKESLGALQRNELLFFLLDEVVPPEAGVAVDFFNRKVTRAKGPLLFQERTGSPIISMFIVQDEKRHFQISVGEALKLEDRFDAEENAVRNIGQLTHIIEEFVRRYPFQWGGWLNKKWALEIASP